MVKSAPSSELGYIFLHLNDITWSLTTSNIYNDDHSKTHFRFTTPLRVVWRISSGVRRKGPFSRAVLLTALFGFGTPGAGGVAFPLLVLIQA